MSIPLFVRVLLLGLLVALSSTAPAQAPAAPNARVIVEFKSDAALLRTKAGSESADRVERAKALAQRVGVALTAGPAVNARAQVVVAPGVSSQTLAAQLSQQSDVEYAVADERRHKVAIPNDALYFAGPQANGPASGQWYLRPPSAQVPAGIDAQSAWDMSTGSSTIVVADIDTGVRFEHPDLLAVAAGGNLLPGYDMVSDVDMANDGDGRDADASDPGDWVTQAEIDQRGGPFYQCEDAPEDSSWHGTQVAGIVAALTNNGIGMASVGRTVRLLPVRALGKCGGFDSDIIAGMQWAAGLSVPGVPANPTPAKVINLSLGGEGVCTAAYVQAVAEIMAAGVTIVASAGNSSGHAVGVPANCGGVIAVAGLRHAGDKVGFSDLGAEIAVAAPAGNCVNTTSGSPCLYPILTTSDSGTTTATGSTYTDSFNASLGTSFAAPLVAGTAALMLSVRPTLAPAQVRQIVQATARFFPTTGGDNGDGTIVPACKAPQHDASGDFIDQLQCYCTTNTCGTGMLDTYASVLAASTGLAVASAQYEGMWWNAPANSESGWGLNIAQQGDVLFVTWFTYDTSGKAWWLSMTATRGVGNTYSGTWYVTHGPAFNAVPFDSAQVTRTAAGTGTLTFTDANTATFSYTVNGTSQSKSITRLVFGDVPTCTSNLQANVAAATNHGDLWWAAPAGNESGWGLNLVEQSNVMFGTWFTYDTNGAPLWLSVTLNASGAGRYSGTLLRATGPAFSAIPFNPANVVLTPVGTAMLTFSDGNTATFAYTVNGVSQTKAITRQVFSGSGTTCR